jgi:copper homeostasis protein
MRLLEICVDSLQSAWNAQSGGADRIELCENLYQGGVTPSAAKIKLAVERLHIPVFVLIRPRKGDFLYAGPEFDTMLEDIRIAKSLGAAGIVSGVLLPDGEIDLPRTCLLVEAAHPLPFTFHRAFDMCREPLRAIDQLADAGVQHILSSGQQPSAALGLDNLRRFARHAGARITVMACGGLLPDNIAPLLEIEELQAFHAAARRRVRSDMQFFGATTMGDEALEEEFQWHEADADIVAGLRAAMKG